MLVQETKNKQVNKQIYKTYEVSRRKETQECWREKDVSEDLSEEVTLSPDWKDKETTSYEQRKEGWTFQETALAKSLSRNNLSTELRTERRLVWPEHGLQVRECLSLFDQHFTSLLKAKSQSTLQAGGTIIYYPNWIIFDSKRELY